MDDEALSYMSEVADAANVFSWDLLLFAGLAVLIFGYAYTFGKDYIVPAVFSLYIA